MVSFENEEKHEVAIEMGSGALGGGAKTGGGMLHKTFSESVTVRSFSWRDLKLTYAAPAQLMCDKGPKPQPKVVMQSVSCYVEAGSFVAVIGASGAGKSTLLDILARRRIKAVKEGHVYVNGAEIDDSTFKEISSYMPQEDVFSATATPREALMFIANLKLPPKMPMEQKKARVLELAQGAGLAHRLDVRIGGVVQGGLRLKGISGGERRRLALVACQITDPCIMFLDEPTSGLDSCGALNVMSEAAKGAKRPGKRQIILCTIHQPRKEIWDLFTHTLILGTGGYQVYYGPTFGVVQWFNSALHQPMPEGQSVSDFVLDLLNADFVSQEEDSAKEKAISKKRAASVAGRVAGGAVDMLRAASTRILTLPPAVDDDEDEDEVKPKKQAKVNGAEAATTFKASEMFKDMVEMIDEEAEEAKQRGNTLNAASMKASLSWFRVFPLLLQRNGQNYLRNPGCLAARVCMILMVAGLTGVSFKNVAQWRQYLVKSPKPTIFDDFTAFVDLQVYMMRVLSSLFMTCITLTLLPFVSISLFIYDRQFYNKESRAKLYPASAYFLANTLLEAMVNCFTGFLFGIIVYYMTGYGTEDPANMGPVALHIIKYLALIMLISNVGCLQSIMFSLLSPNTDIAFVLNCGYVTISLLTSGFLVPPHDLRENSILLSGLGYISVIRYGFRALVANEFEGVVFHGLKNIQAGNIDTTAKFILSSKVMQLGDLNIVTDSVALVGVSAVFASISFWALKNLYKD